ncbi:hypothetical protein HanIR_Chr03g0122481 [Helianthus annuus]|nr:hypothetical protein HanIR_Chr03g0122481 [Helianthus annuus]
MNSKSQGVFKGYWRYKERERVGDGSKSQGVFKGYWRYKERERVGDGGRERARRRQSKIERGAAVMEEPAMVSG